MTTINAAQTLDLNELAAGHDAFATPAEFGGEAATDAPASSPFCVGIIVGATLGAGC